MSESWWKSYYPITGEWGMSGATVQTPFQSTATKKVWYEVDFFQYHLKTESWEEMQSYVLNIIMSGVSDTAVIEAVSQYIKPLIPVRSGKLLDYILSSMYIQRKKWFHNVGSLTFWFSYPPDYPRVILNSQHSGEIGYGPLYSPAHNIPNVKLLETTKTGKGKYLLNDPMAVSSPDPFIIDFAINEMQRLLKIIQNAVHITMVYIPSPSIPSYVGSSYTASAFASPINSTGATHDMWSTAQQYV